MKSHTKAIFTIPEWEKIPFLVHGFGSKYWRDSDFQDQPILHSFERLYLRQIHSDIVHVVEEVPEATLSGDALLTVRAGLLLVIQTADCLPVLMVDPEKKALAAVHCGWRSMGQELIRKSIRYLEGRFQCDPATLLVALGPCIERACYEVGEDVRTAFRQRGLSDDVFFPHPHHRGKYYLDLKAAAENQLLDDGVKDAHIFRVNRCTYCEEVLFSYRESRRKAGRLLSFIGKTAP
jgi:hypothetical protein